MTTDRRKFTREGAEVRKEALIQATLDLVAEKGVAGATVRAISDRAEVTQGLVRHYFHSKEALIQAAFAHHMRSLTDLAEASGGGADAKARLAGFLRASLEPPVVEPRALSLWSGFMSRVPAEPEMRQIHAESYVYFRDKLEGLIAAALRDAGRDPSTAELRRLAIACNAVADGLWLEGGALPDAFATGELAEIGLEAVGRLLDLPLQ